MLERYLQDARNLFTELKNNGADRSEIELFFDFADDNDPEYQQAVKTVIKELFND